MALALPRPAVIWSNMFLSDIADQGSVNKYSRRCNGSSSWTNSKSVYHLITLIHERETGRKRGEEREAAGHFSSKGQTGNGGEKIYIYISHPNPKLNIDI